METGMPADTVRRRHETTEEETQLIKEAYEWGKDGKTDKRAWAFSSWTRMGAVLKNDNRQLRPDSILGCVSLNLK